MKPMLAARARRLLPGSIRRHRIWGGPLRGMFLYGAWRDYPRAFFGRAEPELLDWFDRRAGAGETWLDVGAHYGYTTLALARKVGSAGRVFAFEPVLTTAGALRATRDANSLSQMTVVPLALDDQPRLTVSASASTFRGMAQMKHPKSDGEQIYSISLDALWPRLCCGADRIAGIKIDVQGMEVEAVRGMKETLLKHRPRLLVEYHGYADLEALLEALADAGYRDAGKPLGADAEAARGTYSHGESYEFIASV